MTTETRVPVATLKRDLDPDVSIPGCKIIYAPAGQAGEYAPLATNPYRGCGHKCAYCLSPDTLIQLADGSTLPIGDVPIGADLIGVVKGDEARRAWNWKYAASRVLNRIDTNKPAFRVTLDNGQTAICSEDHRWLTERGWKFTKRLTTNNEIRTLAPTIATPAETENYRLGYLAGLIRGDGLLKRYDYSGRYQRAVKRSPQKTDVQHQFRLAIIDREAIDRATKYLKLFGVVVTQFKFSNGERGMMHAIRTASRAAFDRITDLIQTRHSKEWLRGWIAGVFDAEGSYSAVVRISNSNADILSLTDRAFASHGFTTARDSMKENGVTSVRLQGGREEIVRMFNLTNPAIKRKFTLPGQSLRGSSRVVSVEPMGRSIPMVDITTSTENFVANGMISHNCYVPKVLRMDRAEFDAGAVERAGFLDLLAKDARKYKAADNRNQVMLSFTTDPYHPGDNALTRRVLETLRDHGLGFCTLTKGGARALRDLDLFRPDRDAFASTLTSLDDAFSHKWERGAAPASVRVDTLRQFHAAGVYTWVSLEPTLDVEASLAIVRETHRFVDLFKIGRVNYLPMTKTTDWRDYTVRMLDLCQQLGAAHYIKKDLQPFLPAGYPNPKRVQQHH